MTEYKVLVVTALIFVVFTLVGLARGLIKTLFATFALAAALLIAATLGPQVGKFLAQTVVYDSIYHKAEKSISEELRERTDMQVSDQIAWIDELPLPEQLRTGMIENNHKDVYEALGIHVFAEYVAGYLASLVTNILAYILTFLVAFILIRLLELVCQGLKEIPVLGMLDRVAGMLLGAFNGVMVIWLGFIILTMFCATTWGQQLLMEIEQTPILKTLYAHNYFMRIVQNISQLFF